jgi:sugar phosphate isomerase/epimerase
VQVGLAGRGFYGRADSSALETLKLAHAHGLDGFFFPSPFNVSPTLDAGELREARALADDFGLYLEIGIGGVNPLTAAQSPEVLAHGDGDYLRGMERLVRACHAIGCNELWCLSGGDRFSTTVPWREQIQAIRDFLASLAPIARDLGCHLNLETHEDITSFEVVRMVEAVGPDVMGITLDIANVVVRAEDPVAATRRVAPYVRQTHVEDVVLWFVETGLWRGLRPCGEGVIDWDAVLDILGSAPPSLNLSIELHNGQFGLEIFDPKWLALHPDLTVVELAEIVRLAKASDVQLTKGLDVSANTPPRDETDEERVARLQVSVRYLRDLLRRKGLASEAVA